MMRKKVPHLAMLLPSLTFSNARIQAVVSAWTNSDSTLSLNYEHNHPGPIQDELIPCDYFVCKRAEDNAFTRKDSYRDHPKRLPPRRHSSGTQECEEGTGVAGTKKETQFQVPEEQHQPNAPAATAVSTSTPFTPTVRQEFATMANHGTKLATFEFIHMSIRAAKLVLLRQSGTWP